VKKQWEDFLPPVTLDVHEQHLQEFFTTMHKRQDIWYRRTLIKVPSPWSDDEILNNYRFCNVYRELDRSSQYLINNVYLKQTNLTGIVFCIIAHRIYNKPETFDAIGYPNIREYDEAKWLSKLLALEEQGFKTLNQEAYKINTYMWGGEPRWHAYTKHILSRFAENIRTIVKLVTTGTALEVVKELKKYCGIFLVHEIYQDLCDLNRYIKKDITKFDKNAWSSAGPGAKGGLRLIFPSLPGERAEEGLRWLLDLSSEWLKKVSYPGCFKYLNWDAENKKYFVSTEGEISVAVIEFWACEFLKVKKIQWKAGKQRQKFSVK
jgi:hypothetical protein